MRSAIVVGGNGLIGRALVAELANAQIPVLVLGTSQNPHDSLEVMENPKISYLCLPRSGDWRVETLRVIEKHQELAKPVFFNLAWKGKAKLVDGGIRDQLKNVALSCDLVTLAKGADSERYVATGSMEEVILERLLRDENWRTKKESGANWYALAKESARMQSAFSAYQQQIDFCYARISVVIAKSLETKKFVEQSLKGLLAKPEIPVPQNPELCNISSSVEIARQLVAIGKLGTNKHVYHLGTGLAASLYEHFVRFAQIAHSGLELGGLKPKDGQRLLNPDDFGIGRLVKDTGYQPQESVMSLFSELAGSR